MEQQTDPNGELWEQQRLLKDLQREVARLARDQEWAHDSLREIREQVQAIASSQWVIRGRLAWLIGGLVGFAAIFGFVTGSMFPWFGR